MQDPDPETNRQIFRDITLPMLMPALVAVALIRFITPCTEDIRKLSDPDFMINRWTPTTARLRSAIGVWRRPSARTDRP